GIRPVGALRRTPHRIKLALRVVEAVTGWQLAQHLLGHLPCALPQLLKRPRLLLARAVEITLAQRPLGALHGFAGTVQLTRGLQAELTQPSLQPAKHLAQLSLPIAERIHLIAVAVALLALTLLPAPALALLALPTLALAALLAEGVVKQLLLTAKQVAKFVHHLAETLALALVGHAARLQPIQQVAQLAQHLLGHVAVAGARHVLEVAEQLLDVLRRHELAVAIQTLRGGLVLRLLGELLQELCQRLPQLLHELLDLFVGCALLQSLRQPLLGSTQGPLGV